MAKVTTTLGDVDERDLDVVIDRAEGDEFTWVVTRECRYNGTTFPAAKGEVVRRDVWVTFKVGQTSQVVSEL